MVRLNFSDGVAGSNRTAWSAPPVTLWRGGKDTLCDHICEYDVSASDDGYREAIQLASAMKFDLENLVFNHLKDVRA